MGVENEDGINYDIKTPKRIEKLLNFNEIAPWRQENRWVRGGYRPLSNSVHESVKSLFYLHNESMNIYTHLIPALAILLPLIWTGDYAFVSRYPNASFHDRLIFFIYTCGVLACFLSSSIYHLFMGHSKAAHDTCLKVDFMGVLALILTAFISLEYVDFKCYSTYRNIHWTMISASIFTASYIVLHPRCQNKDYRTFRTMAFILVAASAFIPMIHMWTLFEDKVEVGIRSGVFYWFSELAVLLCGVVLFLCHIPERVFPGTLDYFGSSHQIFHVMVVLSVVVHMKGLWRVYDVTYHDPICNI